MQLKYPKKRDFWSWNELSCFARALGFSKDLFKRNVPKDFECMSEDGLTSEEILDLIDAKALAGDLHRTFNMYDAAYNAKVIQKSMELLANRLLSFQDIKDARMAFQLYEHMDNAGLVINDRLMMRTLKLCGRTISQIKLMQHIKHMDRLVQDRLMFYEFLEILLLCERIGETKTPVSVEHQKQIVKDDRNLFQLEDFRSLLLTQDEKVSEHLNEVYKKSLEKMPLKRSAKQDDVGEDQPWRTESIVNHRIREGMVEVNSWQKDVLIRQLGMSNQEVSERGTFPSCNCDKECLARHKGTQENNDFQHRLCDSRKKGCANPLARNPAELLRYTREPIVTEKDLAETKCEIDDLQWNIATQGERMRKKRERTGRRQKRIQHSHFDKPEDEELLKQGAANTRLNGALRDTMQPHVSKEFRSRLKDMSIRAAVKRDSISACEGKPKSDAAMDSKTSLGERLTQIDMMMDRVCQR